MKDDRDQGESKLDGAEIELHSSNPTLKWLDNFWYHHKWKVIVIAFFAVILIVGILQMAGKEEIDETLLIAVPERLYLEEQEAIHEVLVSLMPSSASGEKSLLLKPYSIYSEEELEAVNEAETDEEGHDIVQVFPSENADQIKEYNSYLNTGECSLLLISPYLYETQRAHDRLMPLSEVFGDVLPKGALSDGYGVRLGDTYLYEYFEELRVLPADTVICLRRAYIFGASSDEERYAATKEFFKNIVTFGN